MDFKLIYFNDCDWNSLRDSIFETDFFGSVEFLQIVSKNYSLEYKNCAVLYKDQPVILFSFFYKSGNIILPNHYYYQYIWFKDFIRESWIVVEGIDFLLVHLKNTYKRINIRLPLNFRDIRPFIWQHFDLKIRYTYIKDLSDFDYHSNIKRILKKANESFAFKNDTDWDLVWEHHIKDLRNFNISKNKIDKYLLFFKGIKELGALKTFNIYYNGNFISSVLAIIDKSSKRAYFPLIGTTDSAANGASAKLYHFSLETLKGIGILKVDFCGANMKTIARFKQKFNPSLRMYYEVFYNKDIYYKIRSKINLYILNLKLRFKNVTFFTNKDKFCHVLTDNNVKARTHCSINKVSTKK